MTIDIGATPLTITTRGSVSSNDEAYASDKITRLIMHVPGPVLYAEVMLIEEPDPARERPSIAEAVLDVNGQPVRAHVAAHEMGVAIDRLEDRLRRRLDRFAHLRDDRRERLRSNHGPDAREWRHGDRRAERPEYFSRPVEDREVVRRKSYAYGEMTPDEAADALDLLGHDFFLFTNAVTGADAVVWYAENHDLELIDASDRADALGPDTVAPIALSKLGAPRYRLEEATQQLDLDLVPFVFFVDADSGRGHVAYHRYDGHYGLISPP